MNVLADRALDSVERLLLSIDPANLGFKDGPETSAAEAAKLEIENGTHQLETLLNAAIDKNFDLFELYAMNNILKVRPEDQPFMRLSHYEGLDFDSARNGRERVDEESVNALRRRLHASQKLHLALEQERARNDNLLLNLRHVVGASKEGGTIKQEEGEGGQAEQAGPLKFLRDKGSLEEGGTNKPITTTTEFTLSQLQALRSLSTSLRALLPQLGPQEGDNSGDGLRSWRSERVEYVEGASRKYLENSGGLDLGEQGEVRDGEWRGEGRDVGREEVEGLERVVAILGKEALPPRSQSEPPMDDS